MVTPLAAFDLRRRWRRHRHALNPLLGPLPFRISLFPTLLTFLLLFYFSFFDTFSPHLFMASAQRECSETPPKLLEMFILFSLRRGHITKSYFNAFKCLMSADNADLCI